MVRDRVVALTALLRCGRPIDAALVREHTRRRTVCQKDVWTDCLLFCMNHRPMRATDRFDRRTTSTPPVDDHSIYGQQAWPIVLDARRHWDLLDGPTSVVPARLTMQLRARAAKRLNPVKAVSKGRRLDRSPWAAGPRTSNPVRAHCSPSPRRHGCRSRDALSTGRVPCRPSRASVRRPLGKIARRCAADDAAGSPHPCR
jgi:hypothetical protein